ncbi:MAG: site-specific integrase [Candidatus Bathyarchaeia archaeon]
MNVALDGFGRFLAIDLAMTRQTVNNHLWKVRYLLAYLKKPLHRITKDDLRAFLEMVRDSYSLNTYSCFIKTIRRFFRDYLGRPDLANFRFPTIPFAPKMLNFDRRDLQRFHDNIEHPVVRMMFLGYCVTGLRRNDIMFLKRDELYRDSRMIVKNNGSQTKHRWVTFYNEELEKSLHDYLDSRKDDNPRVFPVDPTKTFQRHWKLAQDKTGLSITPKDLRDWFCMEMTELGVPDRYIDAFCGRVPKTVLGRHYTDYSPKKLKEVYDKANLRLFA